MQSSDRVNVLFVQSQPAFGADSLIHAHLMRHLDRSRFGVHVACSAPAPGKTTPSFEAIARIPDIRLRPTQFAPGLSQRAAADIWRGAAASVAFPLDFVALARYVRKHRIQVIHGTEKPRDAAYAVALGKLTGAKSVVHVHVKWSDEYSAAARWAVREADAAFGISRYVTETIVGMGKPRRDVFTILNCLDAGRWDPSTDGGGVRREFAVEPGQPLLVSVSRLFSWKGQRELVQALAIVKRKFPNVRLLIVGYDERYVHKGSFTEELKELTRSLGLEQNVTFTGGRDDIPAIMAASDLYAMPSFEEPFGVVFLEAMAMARAVVAVNNGGTPEVIEHGRAGLLSPPWNVEALAENILALLEDPARARAMGEYGRRRVLEYFNPERMAREAADAYTRLLAGLGAEAA
ncbi:MAG TPA: glycosyltransferase family 4 protein [Polyangiaceae bacterium]